MSLGVFLLLLWTGTVVCPPHLALTDSWSKVPCLAWLALTYLMLVIDYNLIKWAATFMTSQADMKIQRIHFSLNIRILNKYSTIRLFIRPLVSTWLHTGRLTQNASYPQFSGSPAGLVGRPGKRGGYSSTVSWASSAQLTFAPV